MGKGQRVRAGRADKQRRRAARQATVAVPVTGLPGGWHTVDELDAAFAGPPEDAVPDTSTGEFRPHVPIFAGLITNEIWPHLRGHPWPDR